MLLIFLLWTGLTAVAQPRFLSPVTTDDAIQLAYARPDIDSFLHGLPYLLRDAYVLSLASRGSQPSTPLFPRAINFGRNMMLTFNGCAGPRRQDVVGLMDMRGDTPELIELNFTGGKVAVTHDPVSCRRCHGQVARPLWPSSIEAPHWTGFYGAGTAGLTGEREIELLGQFKRMAAGHPRYSALLNLDQLTAYVRPSLDRRSLYSANFDFEALISRVVARSAFAYLRAHPRYREARLPLLTALSLAHDFDHYYAIEVDVSAELAAVMGRPLTRVRRDLARHEAAARLAIMATAESNRRIVRHALGRPDLDFGDDSPDDRKITRYKLAAALAYVAEAYGLSELEPKMSTSRVPGGHGYPGHVAPVTGPAVLEQMLAADVLLVTGLTDDAVARSARTTRAGGAEHSYAAWTSTQVLRAGLSQLATALDHPSRCDQLLIDTRPPRL